MIDELIPDLSDPKLRALYEVLRGRREPRMDEKSVLVAVGAKMAGATNSTFNVIDVLGQAMCDKITLLIIRASRIDASRVAARFIAYMQDIKQEAEKEVPGDRQV